MKKVNDTYIFLLLFVLAVGLFLLVFFVPLKNTNEEIKTLEKSNDGLRTEISELQVYHDNKSQYESDTETLKSEIVNIISSYPSGYREEDFILEGIAMENASEDIQFSGITMNEAEVLATVDQKTMNDADIDEFDGQIEFVKRKIDYSNEITYDSLKQALSEVFDSDYKANIESVSYTKNEQGVVLNGVISLGYYYVNGNGKEYVPPVVPKYEAGTENIFLGGHTVELTVDEEGTSAE